MDGDDEMEALRQKRMAEMQANRQKQEAQEEQKQMQDEQKRIMLTQILTGDARERLARVRLVKPERAARVENYVINLAQTGKLRERVTEPFLKRVLEQVGANEQRTKVTFTRRYADSDDDSDDDW